jgi:hypothetical protein
MEIFLHVSIPDAGLSKVADGLSVTYSDLVTFSHSHEEPTRSFSGTTAPAQRHEHPTRLSRASG